MFFYRQFNIYLFIYGRALLNVFGKANMWGGHQTCFALCAQSLNLVGGMLVQRYQYRQKYRLWEYISIGIGWTHIGPTNLAEGRDLCEKLFKSLGYSQMRREGRLKMSWLCQNFLIFVNIKVFFYLFLFWRTPHGLFNELWELVKMRNRFW